MKKDDLIKRIYELKKDAEADTAVLYDEIINELNNNKKYGLVWDSEHTKEDVVLRCEKEIPILELDESKTILNGGENNLIIEGDNYHSLIALNMIKKESIDVIYIDPPYNTGHEDFVYNDKFINEDDGYRHSKWLSFIKRRLELAKTILKEEGVIFISINEIEFANLKILCNEIFGETNVETMIWYKISDGGTAGNGKMKITYRFRNDHEYIIVCYKNKDNIIFKKPMKLPEWKTKYPNKDNDPRGPWCDGEIAKSEKKSSPSGKNYYTIVSPSGKTKFSRQWHFDKKEFERYLSDVVVTKDGNTVSRIWWGSDGEKCPRLKKFQNEPAPTTPTSIIKNISQTDGNNDFDQIIKYSGERPFNNPKPVKLITTLLDLINNNNSLVLDFFAGSGTTGQAVLELNKNDGGNRKFILCTNNENNICEDITYQRIKTIITGKRKDNSKYSEGLDGSLYYFKTNFINDENNTDQARYSLVEKVDSLLCINEDLYINEYRNKYSSSYTNLNKDKYLFIYNDYYNEKYFNEFKNSIKKINAKKVVYVFSTDNVVDEELFKDVKNIELKPIPSKIYEIYKEIVEDIKRG